MAFSSATVSVGGVTRQSDYQRVMDNTVHILRSATIFTGPKTFQSATIADLTVTNSANIQGPLTLSGASRSRATRETAQSIPNVAFTIVQYNTEVFDNLGEYDNATNYRFTATNAGYYSVSASLMSASVAWDAGEYWSFLLYKNGGAYSHGQRNQADAAITTYRLSQLNDIIYLAATDYIDIRAYHTQGAAVNVFAGSLYNFFSVHRLS